MFSSSKLFPDFHLTTTFFCLNDNQLSSGTFAPRCLLASKYTPITTATMTRRVVIVKNLQRLVNRFFRSISAVGYCEYGKMPPDDILTSSLSLSRPDHWHLQIDYLRRANDGTEVGFEMIVNEVLTALDRAMSVDLYHFNSHNPHCWWKISRCNLGREVSLTQ
jgi:hypothetical protein